MEMRPEALAWLLEGTVESEVESGVISDDQGQDVVVTPALTAAIEDYEEALREVLAEAIVSYNYVAPEDADEWLDDFYASDPHQVDVPLDALMTLRGEGVGHWDGRWDSHFASPEIEDLNKRFKRQLSQYADGSGGGSVEDAFLEAVYTAAPPGDYKANAEGPCSERLLEGMFAAIEREAKQAQVSLKKLASDPRRYAPQIEHVRHAHRTIKILSRRLDRDIS